MRCVAGCEVTLVCGKWRGHGRGIETVKPGRLGAGRRIIDGIDKGRCATVDSTVFFRFMKFYD